MLRGVERRCKEGDAKRVVLPMKDDTGQGGRGQEKYSYSVNTNNSALKGESCGVIHAQLCV